MAKIEIPGLPFEEAIRHFRGKLNLPTHNWRELWEGMHARAFTVAGAVRDDLLSDLRAAVDKAIADGTTLAEFRKDFDAIVAKHGWTYRGSRGWRTQTIFRTNVRTAYAAGRWQQIDRTKAALPYLRYVATLDSRTRPQHRTWHGTILPVDHPWWRTHYPPNGWNCRCTAIQLSQRDLDRRGWQVADEAPPAELVPQVVRTADGPVSVPTPQGVDPGWGYNVGTAAWGHAQELAALERHGPWTALESPARDAISPRQLEAGEARADLGTPVRRGDVAALRQALRDTLGGDAATLVDPTGERVRITQAIVDHILEKPESRWDGREVFFPLIPGLVEMPAEIWVGFARSGVSGRIALRRRYVKLLQIDKRRVIGLVADAEDGMWSGMTFFRGGLGAINQLRAGLQVWGAP